MASHVGPEHKKASEVERLARLAMLGGEVPAQNIEHRIGKSLQLRLARPLEVKHHHLVLPGLEPAARQEEGLLRANLPEAPQRAAVDPHHALTQVLISRKVSPGFSTVKLPTHQAGPSVCPGLACSAAVAKNSGGRLRACQFASASL